MILAKRSEVVKIDKIIPYARNARTHSKEQIAQIRASFREFGVVAPLVVDEKYNLLVGHGRLIAARAEGLSELTCIVVEHLTDAQKRAYIIADNRLALNAGWDLEMLSVELADLQGADFDLSLLGFNDVELNSLMGGHEDVKDDDFDLTAALEEAAFAQRGDVWTLGRHRLICGDAASAEDVHLLMDGRKANLVLTDPPYNVAFESASGLKIKNDSMKAEQFYSFLLSAFKCFYENLADGGAFYCFHSDSEKVNFFLRLCGRGLPLLHHLHLGEKRPSAWAGRLPTNARARALCLQKYHQAQVVLRPQANHDLELRQAEEKRKSSKFKAP